MEEISKTIGEKIREAREERGMTQKELGDFLGYSPMGISHFEKGIREIRFSDLKKLADFFGRDISYFLASSRILFRARDNKDQKDIKDSIEAFDKYLLERKHKK